MKTFVKKFTPEAHQLLKHLPPLAKKHLRSITDKIAESPYEGKPLQRELVGYYTERHNQYRIIYSIDKKNRFVIFEYLGLRKDVYNLFSKLIRIKNK